MEEWNRFKETILDEEEDVCRTRGIRVRIRRKERE